MQNPEMKMVSQQLKRLWLLLSDMDAAHVARLARAAGGASSRLPHGPKAA